MFMESYVDPDQLASASDEASWSWSTRFTKEDVEFWKKSNVHNALYRNQSKEHSG